MNNPDICLCICDFLADRDAMRFISCNTIINSLRDKILFTDEHQYEKIKDLTYFNNFTMICTYGRISVLPSNTKSLRMKSGSTSDLINISFPDRIEKIDASGMIWDYEFPKFPSGVKYLALPHIFSRGIELKSKLSFLPDTSLEIISMVSWQFTIFAKYLPKSITTLILDGTGSIRMGDIPDHIINVHMISSYDPVLFRAIDYTIPLSIQYLKIDAPLCLAREITLIADRKLTLVIRREYKHVIEEVSVGPDFKVEYFD